MLIGSDPPMQPRVHECIQDLQWSVFCSVLALSFCQIECQYINIGVSIWT